MSVLILSRGPTVVIVNHWRLWWAVRWQLILDDHWLLDGSSVNLAWMDHDWMANCFTLQNPMILHDSVGVEWQFLNSAVGGLLQLCNMHPHCYRLEPTRSCSFEIVECSTCPGIKVALSWLVYLPCLFPAPFVSFDSYRQRVLCTFDYKKFYISSLLEGCVRGYGLVSLCVGQGVGSASVILHWVETTGQWKKRCDGGSRPNCCTYLG